jgi:hypothetical protein
MTIRSPELETAILDRLANDESLRSICKDEGMPNAATVHRWMQDDAEFASRYARARVIQAETVASGMRDIELDVIDGSMEPAAARVVLDSQRWRASKLAPKKYGDKLEIAGDPEAPLQLVTRRIIDMGAVQYATGSVKEPETRVLTGPGTTGSV